MPRAALLRAQIARRAGEAELAARLLRNALDAAPALLQEELPNLLAVVGAERRDEELALLVSKAQQRDFNGQKHLAFAAIAANLAGAAPLRETMQRVFTQDPTLNAVWIAAAGEFDRMAQQLSALLSQAEKFRCSECGFAGRSFYWHCPACQSWDSFESYAIVKLR